LATKVDLDLQRNQIELRLVKWLSGVGVTASVAIIGALSGVIWAATQALLHAR
jgi:hypothetical protein